MLGILQPLFGAIVIPRDRRRVLEPPARHQLVDGGVGV